MCICASLCVIMRQVEQWESTPWSVECDHLGEETARGYIPLHRWSCYDKHVLTRNQSSKKMIDRK